MPLFYTETIAHTGVLGIWEIVESIEELEYLLLPNEFDRNYLSTISHPGRHRQALAARVLACQLLSSNGDFYSGIIKDNSGKPYLSDSSYHISLSHTQKYAAVLFHPQRQVGIDIEESSLKLIRVKSRFLTHQEQVQAGDNLHKLSVYWCVKEAIYKFYRAKSLAFGEIQVKAFELCPKGTLSVVISTPVEEKEVTVFYRRIATFSMAWVVAAEG